MLTRSGTEVTASSLYIMLTRLGCFVITWVVSFGRAFPCIVILCVLAILYTRLWPRVKIYSANTIIHPIIFVNVCLQLFTRNIHNKEKRVSRKILCRSSIVVVVSLICTLRVTQNLSSSRYQCQQQCRLHYRNHHHYTSNREHHQYQTSSNITIVIEMVIIVVVIASVSKSSAT